MSPRPDNPLKLRFVFVVGKGGVGKSTVSAALATAAANEGKRVLVAMCNTKDRLSQLFDSEPVGSEIVSVHPGIDAVNMQPAEALREYGMMILRVRALYKVIFENKYVTAFLRGTPGLDAWAMLGKAQHHARELRDDGSPRYDLVIVDAPATGHGLDLLRVPRVITEIAPPGLLRREAEKAWEMFSDPAQSGVLLVTLPEDMPTNETLELHEAITTELSLPICGLVVNHVTKDLFDAGQRTSIEQMHGDYPDDGPLRPLVDASHRRIVRDGIQRNCIETLRQAIPHIPLLLPRQDTMALGLQHIEALAERLQQQL